MGGEVGDSFSLNEREIVSVYMLARSYRKGDEYVRGERRGSKIMEKLARNFNVMGKETLSKERE